jgi:hypothetical protein
MAGWKKIVTESAASTISQNTTGSAATLTTARSIGGVNFDGSAAIVPTTIVVADTTDTTCFVGLWESATGSLLPKTDAGLAYNAGTGMLTATGFTGPLTGTASAIADEAVDEDALALTGDAGVDGEILSSDGAGGFTWEAAAGGGTITSVSAGNGLDFTTITASGPVTMGTPGTATAASSNAVTTTSHTHAVTTTADGAGTASTILAADASGDLQLHDLTLTGDLKVDGTSTIIESTTTQITDPVIQLNVVADQSNYTDGDSAVILGNSTQAHGGKVVNTDTLIKFTSLHSDDMVDGTLPAGVVTAGSYKDIAFSSAVYEEQSVPATVNGKVYFDGADLYLYVD